MNFEQEADDKLLIIISLMNKKSINANEINDIDTFDSSSAMILVGGNKNNLEKILSAN
jgi:hypothetical protein